MNSWGERSGCIVAVGESVAVEARGVEGEAGEGEEEEGALVVGAQSPASDASNAGPGDTGMGGKGGEETEKIRKTAKETNLDPKSRLRQGWIIRYQMIRRERLPVSFPTAPSLVNKRSYPSVSASFRQICTAATRRHTS